MLILGPSLQPQQMLASSGTWDTNNNIVWSNSLQPHLFELSQQIGKQRWNNLWQWPVSNYNKNSNEKVTQWQDMQLSNLLTPIMQQNYLPIWENGNQWEDNVQMRSNWQNAIQNEANDNQWLQNEWQGEGQQLSSQYPQILQANMNQNQYQNANDWNIQKVTHSEYLSTITSKSGSN